MELTKSIMKIAIKIRDVSALVVQFEASPVEAMREVVTQVREAVAATLEQVMDAEIDLFLGRQVGTGNKRNGYVTRRFGIKGVGILEVRVPRDRAGRFESKVVPASRRYDEATEKDLALLHLAGISTRMLAMMSHRVLGIKVSSSEVSESLRTVIPGAMRFLERPLDDRAFVYLYVDGTNFRVRRTTVGLEPTLVVVGVDEKGHKSLLAMVQGDKDSRGAWEMVFAQLKERGLNGAAVKLGIMDGLRGLGEAFQEAFPNAKVARCWVHKARNVFPMVPKRYQADFKAAWDAIQYAENREAALGAVVALRERWGAHCADAVTKFERDLDALLVHYDFPREHWDALRTTNPIERVNKEFKRRSKSMETMGPNGLKALLAFTALRLEFGWAITPITSPKLNGLLYKRKMEQRLEMLTRALIQ